MGPKNQQQGAANACPAISAYTYSILLHTYTIARIVNNELNQIFLCVTNLANFKRDRGTGENNIASDMYNEHFPADFDIVFTNPPFKNKSRLL